MGASSKKIRIAPEALASILDAERQKILAEVDAKIAALQTENHRLHHASMSLFMKLITNLSSIVREIIEKDAKHVSRLATASDAAKSLRRDVGDKPEPRPDS